MKAVDYLKEKAKGRMTNGVSVYAKDCPLNKYYQSCGKQQQFILKKQ